MLEGLLMLAAAAASQPAVAVTNCLGHFNGRFDGEHESAGPYRLIAAHCFDDKGREGLTAPAMSPDGGALAWMYRDMVAIADVSSGRTVRTANTISSPGFGLLQRASPIGWSSDAGTAWIATQQVVQPSHFPMSGLRLVRLARDGTARPVALERSPAGPLDAIQWIPNSAMAIGQFGTAGDYYRPPHADPAPELGMIDIARGAIVDRLPLRELAAFKKVRPRGSRHAFVSAATATVADDGIRAVIVIGGPDGNSGVRWTQGKSPREAPAPTGEDRVVPEITPSGREILFARPLQPDGPPVPTDRLGDAGPPPPPPKPRTGVILELRDYDSDRTIWTLRTTVRDFWSVDTLAISPDGRFALMSWPEKKGWTHQLALVSMKDGTVRQFFPLGVSGGTAGFTDGGNAVWTLLANVISIYRR